MAQRNTVQQKIIAGQLAKLHGSHPTADEVYQSVKDEYPFYQQGYGISQPQQKCPTMAKRSKCA